MITIPRDGPFIFTNNTVVVESGNDSNKNPLSLINFISNIVVESNGRTVPKQDTVTLGETVLNGTKEMAFTLKNTGVGKLILNGNDPVKIGGEGLEDAFAIVQPSSSEIPSGSSLLFTVRFTPKTVKPYTATVRISSNDPSGDYTFTLSGEGVSPKQIISPMMRKVPLRLSNSREALPLPRGAPRKPLRSGLIPPQLERKPPR
ncbi:MAG: hypothetical protein LBD93_03730 [Treponema sp.]|nr:hypothetical protein [Treponema sp.]